MRSNGCQKVRTAVALVLLAGGGAACAAPPGGAGGGVTGASPALDLVGDPGPVQVVERFLRAANSRDHIVMAELFGTADGPAGNTGGTFGCALRKLGAWLGLGERCVTWSAVELRMDAIARLLAHDGYQIGQQEVVAGRDRPAIRLEVDFARGQRPGKTVPFVVIKTFDGRWLVQEIDLARLTASSLFDKLDQDPSRRARVQERDLVAARPGHRLRRGELVPLGRKPGHEARHVRHPVGDVVQSGPPAF